MARTATLTVRKLADYSDGERVTRWNPQTGEKYLADPSDPDTPKPWPLLGIAIEGKPPTQIELTTSWVGRGAAEGWIELEGAEVVHRAGGPPENPWGVTHSFVHASAIVLKTVEGDVRYEVVDNPDKWPLRKNDRDEGFGGEVRWFYKVRLDG